MPESSRLALTVLALSLGSACAAPTVQTLQPAGVTKRDVSQLKVEQVVQLAYALMHARNVVAGLPEDTSDPQPCLNGSLLYGEMKGGQPAYAAAKASLTKQGWQVQKEVTKGTETAFQLSKNGVTALGLWVDVPAQKASAWLMCEQAAEWKPAPPTKAPAASPKLPNSLTFQAREWKGGAQNLRAVLSPAGVSIGTGKISSEGKISLTLNQPQSGQLQPITSWKAAFTDLLDCGDGKGFKGQVSISDPKVTFATVTKLMPQAGGQEPLKPNFTNAGFTQSVSTPLIYTSGPVKLSGKLTCADGDRNLDVNLNLPGGWSAVTFTLNLPDFDKSSQSLTNFDGRWMW